MPAASQQILQTLSAFLDARRLPGDRLCVGLSGGSDSVVLLHALAACVASGWRSICRLCTSIMV
ncbi:MAG: hypothetical protein V5B38_02460 [Candidatus Accumulibacter propinquus]